MSKELHFHEDFHRVTVVMNGQVLSLNAEVEVILKRPTKLDRASKSVWNQLNPDTAQLVTVESVGINDE